MSARRPGLVRGASRIPAALRLLRAQRSLWAWCALPLLLNLAFFGVGLAVFASYYGALAEGLTQLLAVEDPGAWYGWLWVGPLRLLAWLSRWLLLLLAAVAVYFLFTVIGGVLASPFLDVLSQRVERLQTGAVQAGETHGWIDALRSALRVAFEEGKRIACFALGQLAIFALALVPGLQPLAAALALAFSALFLSLDYTGYLLDRRRISFRARGRWAWRHRRSMLGFGAAALGTFLIPGLNFLCLPVLVTGGTVLALELGPPEGSPAVSR